MEKEDKGRAEAMNQSIGVIGHDLRLPLFIPLRHSHSDALVGRSWMNLAPAGWLVRAR
jgi:hypothetical protein